MRGVSLAGVLPPFGLALRGLAALLALTEMRRLGAMFERKAARR